jgi:opacity protein-like surface antigen
MYILYLEVFVKKITAILVIFIFVGAALSAQTNPSAGFMALGDLSFGNGIRAPSVQQSKTFQLQNFNFGGGMFFDVTYVEIFLGCTYGRIIEVKKDHNLTVAGGQPNTTFRKFQGNAVEAGLSVLGKYPIELDAITIFPILGLNYNVFILTWDAKGDKIANALKTFSQFGFQAGAGFDYDLSNNIYFRFEALFQLRLVGNNLKNYGINILNWHITSTKGNYSSFPGIGPVIKAGLGIKFY